MLRTTAARKVRRNWVCSVFTGFNGLKARNEGNDLKRWSEFLGR